MPPCLIIRRLQVLKAHLCSSLLQSLLLASCDVDCGSCFRQLESYSSANAPGGTSYYAYPARQGHLQCLEEQ